MERPEVFYTYEWALAMQRAYRAALNPLLVLASEGDRLVGLAALAAYRDRREVHFLSSTTADYCDFLSAPCDRETLIHATLTELSKQQVGKVVFANLPGDSVSAEILKTSSSTTGFHTLSRLAYKCAGVSLGSQNERENTKASLFGKKIRRYLAALEREGPVTIQHLKHSREIEEALLQFSKAHVARFLATGRASNLARPERRVFLRELTDLLSPSGSVALTRLMAGDRPVAWNYGFQFAGTWFWYQPTFDSKFEQSSPGICLLSKIIAESCDNPDITRVDLGLGDEAYKERFANGTRETLHVTLSKSVARHAREVVRYKAATVVKRSPSAEQSLRRVIATIRKRTGDSQKTRNVANRFKRLRESIFSSPEIEFYEWMGEQAVVSRDSDMTLQSLDLELLAAAAMGYSDDQRAQEYLLQSAGRLRSRSSEGYALAGARGTPVHICWLSPFGDSHFIDLGEKFRSLVPPEASFLSDAWTPPLLRGNGFAIPAARMIAERLRRDNRRLWIPVRSSDMHFVQKLQSSGFQRRYSILQNRLLFYKRVRIRKSEMRITSLEVPVAS
jgi:CelD/BcsL family acetyltransferase involved in cellulose biosynthesis